MPYETLKQGIDWSYLTYPEYIKLLENKKLALNICSYIGHSALRVWAMGEEAMKREANEKEIILMEEIVSNAMQNGAIGFSTSTFEGHNGANGIPMPSRFASNVEISRLIKAMATYGRGIFMITKSNNTTISDIAKLLGEVDRPAMVAALLHNPVKKDWAYNTLEEIKSVKKKGYEIHDNNLNLNYCTKEHIAPEIKLSDHAMYIQIFMKSKNIIEPISILSVFIIPYYL